MEPVTAFYLGMVVQALITAQLFRLKFTLSAGQQLTVAAILAVMAGIFQWLVP